jgi:hypothetical protein
MTITSRDHTVSDASSATESAAITDRDVGVVMAFAVAHAPQIFLRPAQEDPAELDRVHDGYRLFADRSNELDLDLLAVVALDHMHSHFLNLVPTFTVFTGDPVVARFNGVDVVVPARPDLADRFVDHLLDHDFDPAFSQHETLDHSFMIPLHSATADGRLRAPVLPLVINAYIPPQPSMRRCARFGEEIHSWASAAGLRVGVVATGGLSHFPGTDRFWHPDIEADQRVLDLLRAGAGDTVIGWEAAELDRIGMVELRTWAVALGARGSRRPATVHSYWDSGHCGYAVVEL